jgi:lysophospholipase L1-like esterase
MTTFFAQAKRRRFAIALPLLAIAFFTSVIHADEVKKGPERWNGSMSEFEARDKATPPKVGTLLFVGSSSIRKWDLSKSWPDAPAINNGFGGSTLADSSHHFDKLFKPYDPSAIILYAGDNDISNGLTPDEVVADFKILAGKIKSQFPGTPVIFIAIKPSQKRASLWPQMKETNDAIAAICKKEALLHFADIARPMLKEASPPPKEWFIADGLHLSTMGYKRWTAVINRALGKVKE